MSRKSNRSLLDMVPEDKPPNDPKVPKVENEVSFLKLNDDCLHEIFSYFNLREVMILETVCDRFENVANKFYREQKKLNLDQLKEESPISEKEIKKIALIVGSFANSLKIFNGKYFSQLVDMRSLLTNFTKLEHLHIENINMMDYLEILIGIFPQLKTLKLINCRLNDDIGTCLKAATKLESLYLSENKNINGTFLKDMKFLTDIDLSSCNSLLKVNFFEFANDNPTLRSWNILSWLSLNHECLQALVDGCKNLESLRIGGIFPPRRNDDINLKILANLPKLKHLQLDGYELPDVELCLECLTSHLESLDIFCSDMNGCLKSIVKLKKLKKLRIVGIVDNQLNELTAKLSCKNIFGNLEIPYGTVNDDSVLKFVKQCPQLKNLNLKRCSKISDTLIIDMVPILNERPQKTSICIAGTSCTKNLENQLTLLGNCKIQLDWDFHEYD
ncbi:hypothetical protein DMENIID0001_138550 [Sergentomyia squamirostris]